MKKILSLTFSLLFLFTTTVNVWAVVDPLATPNNKFGIHIVDTNDLEDAAKLVNSGGGDWGYVTLVIRQDERNNLQWQQVFDKMRDLHLIPIIRIASIQENSHWKKLEAEDIKNWVDFFNSLNWVVQNRYVIVGNEPNHATEWGNKLSPSEYATYLLEFSQKIKTTNKDYFILPAGFDASAANTSTTMDEANYIRLMLNSQPDLFNNIDGWASHSYPNPDFSGDVNGTGKGTVRTYQWERDLVRSLGITKTLPIFITETGWKNNIDSEITDSTHDSDNYKIAYEQAWNDKDVVAVTPFVLSYLDEPFEEFSWKNEDGTYKDFYQTVSEMTKEKGTPAQKNYWLVKSIVQAPQFSTTFSSGIALVKNMGQKIWEKSEYFKFTQNNRGYNMSAIFPNKVKPGETSLMFYTIK